MPTPQYSESDTRAKLINPALYKCGWTEDHIRREANAGGLIMVRGRWKREQKLVDYMLSLRVEGHPEMVPVAIIEAKKNTLPPGFGLEQAKQYADARRLNVPFVYSSNGYQYVEFDRATGITSPSHAVSRFPTPGELRRRYEEQMGFRLDDEIARPLLTPYKGGDSSRRYYQDAAIRALLEAIAQGKNRLLLSLATGAGKTRIAALLLRRIADAGQLTRVLFVCDRTELRDQATLTFRNWFGNDAQPVGSDNACKNARILIATYQTLDVDTEDADANFFLTHYPENYFSHIVIDECHRSAWGKWSIVLTHNPDAIQVGLTATPRQIKGGGQAPADADEWLTADNLRYFGEPVYQYDMGQAIKDGYLAACEIFKSAINLDDTGITVEQIIARQPRDLITGDPVPADEIRALYEKTSYERRLILPDRVQAMTQDLFDHLLATGRPEQKTILFCVSDNHADQVATRMNNLYNAWCAEHGQPPKDHYAFKCTAANSGNDMLPDFRGSANSYFIATTVDLLSTGVDVPRVQNIAFFRYLQSPLTFRQMVGRGTRLYPPDNKLAFRVYDYTDATDLFGQEFITERHSGPTATPGGEGDDDEPKERPIEVEGFDVIINDAGRSIVTEVNGIVQPVPLEEYKQMVAEKLVAQAPDLDAFRQHWIDRSARQALMRELPEHGQSAVLVQTLEEMEAYDLYDVLADLAYGVAPLTRVQRAEAFAYKQVSWLGTMPAPTAATVRALAAQFARGGTDELESQYVWRTSEVQKAGGLSALRESGTPAELLHETKARVFAA